MSENFIQDLNEYFSKKYVNFDLISTLPSYESVTISMVLHNKNRIEEGEVATNEVRKIFYQPHAEQVLAELKERYVDNNFTFSVRVSPLRLRWKALLRMCGLHGALIAKTVRSYGEDPQTLAPRLGVEEKLWQNVLKSYYIPEKVLLLLSFFGGAAGGLLGMLLFRHKTRHWYFWAVNFLGFAWQAAALVLLFMYA